MILQQRDLTVNWKLDSVAQIQICSDLHPLTQKPAGLLQILSPYTAPRKCLKSHKLHQVLHQATKFFLYHLLQNYQALRHLSSGFRNWSSSSRGEQPGQSTGTYWIFVEKKGLGVLLQGPTKPTQRGKMAGERRMRTAREEERKASGKVRAMMELLE